MKEKLVIKNFGPIKSVELELGRFNVLIGEQATGKSTVAKVLAVCRYFSYIIWDDSIMDQMDSSFSQGLAAWGLKEHITNDSFIFYECKHYSVTVQYNKYKSRNWFQETDEIIESDIPVFSPKVTPLSEDFRHLLLELEAIKPKSPGEYLQGSPATMWRIPTSFFLNDVKAVMDNPFYLPTERGLQSVFSLGQASIPNLANFLYNYFSRVDGVLRTFKTETEVEPLNILFINKNGIGYVKKKGEKELHLLSNSASGYQSTIPVVLVINDYGKKNRKKTFIIEEPELNLFPTAQNKLVQFLVDQSGIHNSMYLLTTHSPYVLTSLNNLMAAYQAGKIDKQKSSEILDERYFNPDDVSAYMMLPDGTCEDIIDREEGMIKAEKIDSISTTINQQFSNLLNVEFGID